MYQQERPFPHLEQPQQGEDKFNFSYWASDEGQQTIDLLFKTGKQFRDVVNMYKVIVSGLFRK